VTRGAVVSCRHSCACVAAGAGAYDAVPQMWKLLPQKSEAVNLDE
jgi:hypothetical protein